MKRRVAAAPLLLLILPSILSVADAAMFKINWTSGVNFTDWSSGKHIYVGDWLYFVFNKYQYSVLEVNQTNYEKCVETNFLNNITNGGRDVFQLNDSRPYYFISGFGQCWGGVKLAINVEDAPPPVLSPSKNGSFAVRSSSVVLGILMFVAWCLMPL